MNIRVTAKNVAVNKRDQLATDQSIALCAIVCRIHSYAYDAVASEDEESRAVYARQLIYEHYSLGLALKSVSRASQLTDAQVEDLG